MKKMLSILMILVMMLTFIPVAFADPGVLTPTGPESCTVSVPEEWSTCYWWVNDGSATEVHNPESHSITISLQSCISSEKNVLHVNRDTTSNGWYSFPFKACSSDAALNNLSDSYTISSGATSVAITGADNTMEYRTANSGSTYYTVSSSLNLGVGTYYFRIKATKATVESGSGEDTYYFPSKREKTVTVSPASSEFQFTSPTECEITVPAEWDQCWYRIDSGTAIERAPADGVLTITDLPVTSTVQTIYVSEDEDTDPICSFKFKASDSAPLAKLAASYPLGKDATKTKITNATSAMEYRSIDGNDFTDASANLELGLGDYQFRMKATKADGVYLAPSTVQTVSVVPYIPPVPPTKLNITDPASSCTFTAAGGEHWFIASLLPEDSDKSGYTITWTSSNPNVAKVTDTKENGTKARIVSVAAGTCDITARCEALGLSSVRTVSVQSDFRFTSKNKLIFYYDNRSKTDCNFATTIPADMVSKVTVNGYSLPFYKDTKGNITVLYSTLLNTFGSKSARMPLRVYYGEGSNQYIEKTLYYMSIYDAPLTADTDMTWAYITLLFSSLFITASPFVLKKKHQN